jgi:hypothetical protein
VDLTAGEGLDLTQVKELAENADAAFKGMEKTGRLKFLENWHINGCCYLTKMVYPTAIWSNPRQMVRTLLNAHLILGLLIAAYRYWKAKPHYLRNHLGIFVLMSNQNGEK